MISFKAEKRGSCGKFGKRYVLLTARSLECEWIDKPLKLEIYARIILTLRFLKVILVSQYGKYPSGDEKRQLQ